MEKKTTRSGVLILIVSAFAGCSHGSANDAEYRPVLLSEMQDPLVQAKNFTPWHPPRQMAAFIHPHEDREQGIMIAGHWILVLLGEGSWYFQDNVENVEREPVPDAEAGAEETRAALGAVQVPRDAVVPYRIKEGAKP
jgi:hypothetical protein